MRTLHDLEDAFALLEQAADGYQAPPTPHSHRHGTLRRGALTMVSAAATVAVAVGISSLAGSPANHRNPTGSTHPVTRPELLRQLQFGLHLGRAERLASVSASIDGGQFVTIHTAHGDATLTLDAPSGVDRRIAPEATHVDINGTTGYFASDLGLSYTVPTGASSAPPPDSAAPSSPGERAVAWQATPGRWAVLDTRAPHAVTTSVLLRIARGVDFGATTPVRVPIAFDALPQGFAVTQWQADYRRIAASAPDLPWSTFVTLASGDHEVDVDVSPDPIPDRVLGHGATTVAGRPAYWDEVGGDSALWVDEPHGVTVSIMNSRSPLTEAEARAIAERITVTGFPNDPAKWFDARTALPQ